MNRLAVPYLIIISLLSINISFSQKVERIGYINMEYILSKMEDYKTANQQLEEKIGKWKNEIELIKTEIKVLRDSLEIERPLLTFDIIEDRESEIKMLFISKELRVTGTPGTTGLDNRTVYEPVFDPLPTIRKRK